MRFSECITFCDVRQHKIGIRVSSKKIIRGLIPAPNDLKLFIDYIIDYAKMKDVFTAGLPLGKSVDDQPLLIFKSRPPYFLYGWYRIDFPDDMGQWS